MREQRAMALAAAVAVAILVFAIIFALIQNPDGPAPAVSDQSPPASGRALFESQGCVHCHAIGDRGNPRNPLDGVGAHRKPEELRDWITAGGEARGILSPAVVQAKRHYAELPPEQLDALVAYLAGLDTE